MNKKEYFGIKLYVELGYLKVERVLIKLMLYDEFYDEFKEFIKYGDFVLDVYNKIYLLIL